MVLVQSLAMGSDLVNKYSFHRGESAINLHACQGNTQLYFTFKESLFMDGVKYFNNSNDVKLLECKPSLSSLRLRESIRKPLPSWRKLPEFVTDHFFSDVDGRVIFSVVNEKVKANERREYGARTSVRRNGHFFLQGFLEAR